MWRPSASMILLSRLKCCVKTDFNYKILVQKRGGNISLGGMYAFPGGVFDEEDSNLERTVLRELYEETGILHYSAGSDRETLRGQLKATPSSFNSLIKEPSFPPMYHYCTFVTPTFEKKRYSTAFFISEICSTESTDIVADGTETELNEWLDPTEAIGMHTQGKIKMLPPQFYIFHELSKHRCIDKLIIELSKGSQYSAFSPDRKSRFHPDKLMGMIDCRGYPAMQPSPVEADKTSIGDASEDSIVTLSLPCDEFHHIYPGQEGQRHRIYCGKPIGTGTYKLEKNY
jgi:8-oxo-dGTP pyrophosphatase MutT (NUDIX family)